jgi:CRP/FNR family transcriptional regulator
MSAQLDFLKGVPYFKGLSTSELESVGKLMVERKFEKGDMLIMEDETIESLFFVVSGVLKTFKTSVEGKEQILTILRPGDSFNDVPVFDNEPSPVSIQALSPAVLYELRKEVIAEMIHKNPNIALTVITILAGQVRHLMSLVEDLSFRNVVGRVAKILLENVGDGTRSPQKLTQQEMAAMAGTVREVVGRSLKAMEDSGIIKLNRNRIVINNKEALKEMAGASF